jgi:hypothetical protein
VFLCLCIYTPRHTYILAYIRTYVHTNISTCTKFHFELQARLELKLTLGQQTLVSIVILWFVTACFLVGPSQRFGGTHRFHLQVLSYDAACCQRFCGTYRLQVQDHTTLQPTVAAVKPSDLTKWSVSDTTQRSYTRLYLNTLGPETCYFALWIFSEDLPLFMMQSLRNKTRKRLSEQKM